MFKSGRVCLDCGADYLWNSFWWDAVQLYNRIWLLKFWNLRSEMRFTSVKVTWGVVISNSAEISLFGAAQSTITKLPLIIWNMGDTVRPNYQNRCWQRALLHLHRLQFHISLVLISNFMLWQLFGVLLPYLYSLCCSYCFSTYIFYVFYLFVITVLNWCSLFLLLPLLY